MGTLFVASAPSGAGKTSLLKEVLVQDSLVNLSVSYTTRSPRDSEVDGVDYHFVSKEQFSAMIAAHDFLEHAVVFGNYYGTSKSKVEEQLAVGDVLLELDWQGALSIKRLFGESVWLFVLPPSISVLAERLAGRGTNTRDDIEARLMQAKSDMEYAHQADYVIINQDFSFACNDLLMILHAERLRSSRQKTIVCGIIDD